MLECVVGDQKFSEMNVQKRLISFMNVQDKEQNR